LDDCLRGLSLCKEDINDRIVLHLCDESSPYCALLDLALERLARRFVGTRFRRVRLSDGEVGPFVSRWLPRDLSARLASPSGSAGSLLLFAGGRLAHWSAGSAFGDAQSLRESDLSTFLEDSRVLLETPPAALLVHLRRSGPASAEGEEEEEEGEEERQPTYCGDPRCGKTFPHEHIAVAGHAAKGPSYLLPTATALPQGGAADDAGREALDDNYFSRI
jgi:hypothetical protein